MTKKTGRVRMAAAALATAALAIAGCSSSGTSGSGGSGGPSGLLTVFASSGAFVDTFNPYIPTAEDPTWGEVYEPLMFLDTAQSANVQGWLATGYTWGAGGRSITFALRHDVTWSDGKPFTSADVKFTFDLDMKTPGLNQYGFPITGVTTGGDYSVTIDFSKPAYSDLYYLAGKSYMLPRHIWQSVGNPKTWTDPNPIGTGAFKLGRINSQVMDMTANTHYYVAGLPRFKTLRYITFSGNDSADAAIEEGQVGWAGGFIPNIKKNYIDRDPKNTLVNMPLASTFLVPNMTSGPTADLAVRQAISDALDRAFISQSVYNGYAPAINPDGLLTPNFAEVQNPALAGQSFGGADVAKAKSALEADGYTLSGGTYSKNGQALNLTVKVVSGWTDYISILQIAQQELKAAGINLNTQAEAYSEWANDQYTGNFQLLLTNAGYTPSPYSYYFSLIDSSTTPPIGQVDTAGGNYGRYHNATVDSLLGTVGSTDDLATQRTALYQVEQIFSRQLPDIMLFEAQDEIEFNGHDVSGFPTAANPYAAAANWLSPDDGWVAARIGPAS